MNIGWFCVCRPGDTILLEPGPPHKAAGVVVQWPLHIQGGGSGPEDVVVEGVPRCDAVLDFRWVGQWSGVCVCVSWWGGAGC